MYKFFVFCIGLLFVIGCNKENNNIAQSEPVNQNKYNVSFRDTIYVIPSYPGRNEGFHFIFKPNINVYLDSIKTVNNTTNYWYNENYGILFYCDKGQIGCPSKTYFAYPKEKGSWTVEIYGYARERGAGSFKIVKQIEVK